VATKTVYVSKLPCPNECTGARYTAEVHATAGADRADLVLRCVLCAAKQTIVGVLPITGKELLE